MSSLEERLENFPRKSGDTFERLQAIVAKRIESSTLKSYEKARLESELSVIKETNTASVFLFFYDTVYALKDVGAILHGVCHCSYLLYFLGLTKGNPFDYRLPFERYYGKNRKHLPFAYFVVKTDKKGRLIQYLKEQYGVDKIARVKDCENEYVLSKTSLLALSEIEETFLRFDGEEEKVWHEDISSLTSRDISRLNLYTFTIEEAEIGEYRRFSEEEIYQKTLDCFTDEFRDFNKTKRYHGIEEVEEIFSLTDGKFVYQEQFFEICAELIGVKYQTADEFRKDLCAKRKKETEDIRMTFSWKLGEEGVKLFDYLNKEMKYSVCKAYVLGLLFLDFKKNI